MTENLEAPNSLSSPDIEMSVIGSILVNDNSAYHALNQLDAKDFEDGIYREIFSTISNQYSENYNVDTNLVKSYFKTHKNSEAYKYVNAVQKSINFCNPEQIETYCQKLKSFTFRRELSNAADRLKEKAMDPTVPEDQLYEEIDKTKEVEFRTNPDIARTSEQIKEDAKEQEPQLETGVKEWDTWFYEKGGRGLGTTELIFGRPGHGKTYYLFRKEGELARSGSLGLHFHLEDTDVEAATRIDAVLDPEVFGKENARILVIDKHRYLHDILKDIRYYVHKYGIKWVGVDHLGRVKVHGYSAKDKNSAMIEVSNQLTDTCEALNIHGMFTVQPNKSYKGRRGWDNLLREEDLAGASEIVQDAFVITTLLRPNIYPELRKNEMREIAGSMKEEKWVIGPEKGEAHYNSVFMTQIKNRRQPIGNDFLHMVQYGNKLLTEREFRKVNGDEPVEENPYDVDDLPF